MVCPVGGKCHPELVEGSHPFRSVRGIKYEEGKINQFSIDKESNSEFNVISAVEITKGVTKSQQNQV